MSQNLIKYKGDKNNRTKPKISIHSKYATFRLNLFKNLLFYTVKQICPISRLHQTPDSFLVLFVNPQFTDFFFTRSLYRCLKTGVERGGGSNWLLVDWLFRLMVTKLARWLGYIAPLILQLTLCLFSPLWK